MILAVHGGDLRAGGGSLPEGWASFRVQNTYREWHKGLSLRSPQPQLFWLWALAFLDVKDRDPFH